MAYDNTDPRSLLAGAKAPPPVIDYAEAALGRLDAKGIEA